MTSDVTFTETGFAFKCDGVRIDVHTEVGDDQPTRVVVQETHPEPISEEPSE